MSNNLERFVQEHREEFDDASPAPGVWAEIDKKLKQAQPEPGGAVVKMRFLRWPAVAAAILAVAVGLWLMNHSNHPVATDPIASNTPAEVKPKDTAAPDQGTQPSTEQPAVTSSSQSTDKPALAGNREKTAETTETEESLMTEEMYHYTSLVELKHRELKKIEKDEPLLYRQFASDVDKLDSVYLSLKKQLPKNPNREQLLEAMIQNLKLQMGLLNHQLEIIRQINNSKKSAYEKAYKSA